MPLAPGTRLGKYEIRSQLGAGGMGEVYLAEDARLERLEEEHDNLRLALEWSLLNEPENRAADYRPSVAVLE